MQNSTTLMSGNDRITIHEETITLEEDDSDVIQGLEMIPKRVSSRFLYDDLGSDLFVELCEQPEYYLMRAEHKLLKNHAADIVAATGNCEILDLGSGNSDKVPMLFHSYNEQYGTLDYLPIDINRYIIEMASGNLLEAFPSLNINAYVCTFDRAFQIIPTSDRCRMLIFLGSNMGNLYDDQIISLIRKTHGILKSGDYFLIGADLDKDPKILERAYNDDNGVNERIYLNMLNHLNWKFDADFDLSRFDHIARHNNDKKRMEAYVHSFEEQIIHFKKLDYHLTLKKNETIRAEIMQKFVFENLVSMFEDYRYNLSNAWFDKEMNYALLLFKIP